MAEKTSAPSGARVKKKGGGMGLIIAIVVGVLVIGGGGFAAFKFMSKEKPAEGGDEAKGGEEEGGEGESGSEGQSIQIEEEPEMAVLALEPFLVNLADTEFQRFLRCTIRLAIDSKEHLELLNRNEAVLVKLRSDFLDLMMTRTGAELVTVEGKQKLRLELLERANKVMGKKWVVDLLYTDFVVQM